MCNCPTHTEDHVSKIWTGGCCLSSAHFLFLLLSICWDVPVLRMLYKFCCQINKHQPAGWP